jgi:hypothetical protein
VQIAPAFVKGCTLASVRCAHLQTHLQSASQMDPAGPHLAASTSSNLPTSLCLRRRPHKARLPEGRTPRPSAQGSPNAAGGRTSSPLQRWPSLGALRAKETEERARSSLARLLRLATLGQARDTLARSLWSLVSLLKGSWCVCVEGVE